MPFLPRSEPLTREINGYLHVWIAKKPSWLDMILHRDPGGAWQPMPVDYES